MNRLLVYFSLSLLTFSACNSANQNGSNERKAKEVYHVDELEFQVDTFVNEMNWSYGSKAIPNYYILAQNITDSSMEAHIYADQSLFVIQDKDTINVTKDSLEKDINDAFLNEALLGGLEPAFLSKEESAFLFYVKKPLEDFRYNYELVSKDGIWRVQIVDE